MLAAGVGTADTLIPIVTPKVKVTEPICLKVILGCVWCSPYRYTVEVGRELFAWIYHTCPHTLDISVCTSCHWFILYLWLVFVRCQLLVRISGQPFQWKGYSKVVSTHVNFVFQKGDIVYHGILRSRLDMLSSVKYPPPPLVHAIIEVCEKWKRSILKHVRNHDDWNNNAHPLF